MTNRLVDSATVQGLHGALSCAGVVVLDEAIIVSLSLLEHTSPQELAD